MNNAHTFVNTHEIPIAYMEDDIIAREETANGLINKGFSVEQINNNIDALKFAEKYRALPQVMYVLDINMGSGNATLGIKIARKIKSLHNNSYVILLTSKIREIEVDYIYSAKADEILRKSSINHDIESISQKALSAYKGKMSENSKSALDTSIFLKSNKVEKFLSSIITTYKSYFDIKCISETPKEDFFNTMSDKYISSEFVSKNLATKLIQLSIISKQPHDVDSLEQLLIDFSTVKIPIHTFESLSEYEKKAITCMVLYTKTGSLNSFGSKVSFEDTRVIVTPGIFDLIDTNCETSFLEDNALITVDIKCTIFGVYS